MSDDSEELRQVGSLPKVRDVVASLAINPNTVLKAYKELETKDLAAGRPGQGTFVQATLSQVALPELASLRRSLSGWLTAADGAGLDQDGIVALFTSALRDFYERRGGSGARGGAASNAIHRSPRCLGERGFALLADCWRTLRYITAGPGKAGDIARAALVHAHFGHGCLR